MSSSKAPLLLSLLPGVHLLLKKVVMPPPYQKRKEIFQGIQASKRLIQFISFPFMIHTRGSLMEGLFKHILKQLSRILQNLLNYHIYFSCVCVISADPDAEVVALSPRTLMATNRYICEVCHKGFQRDQNLQLHRRGHNLPWKLKQRTNTEIKKRVYVCPEPNCVHHDPSRALGDLTGIKKHFCRKHGEKKWKCDRCSKRYAVQSDWKAHAKICGSREYRCDCGTIFSRSNFIYIFKLCLLFFFLFFLFSAGYI
jgi:transposase-like protein